MRSAMILGLATALLATTAMAAAPPAPADPTLERPGWKAARNAMGQPDLSGFWSSATMTPLTRNLQIGKTPTLPAAQVKAMEAKFAAALAQRDETTDPNHLPGSVEDKAKDKKLFEVRPDFEFAGGDVGGYNIFWLDPGNHILEVNGEFRTSIVTTADGQVPKRRDGKSSGGFSYSADEGGGGYLGSFVSYETRPESERCISFARNAPPPMLPNGYYNNNYQILQTPDYAVIVAEHIHDARMVRLNGTHRTDGLRPRGGDSIGHYEGNTLVVETTNLPQPENFYGAWKNLKVTEWFTRVSPTRIKYRFQIDDPDTWDKPWGGEYEFFPLNGMTYEYACHEGNYALPAILAGARRQEKEKAEATSKTKAGAD
ncbi:MAG: hypothetical protein ACJ798_10065 [Phenylobacterium sp.]